MLKWSPVIRNLDVRGVSETLIMPSHGAGVGGAGRGGCLHTPVGVHSSVRAQQARPQSAVSSGHSRLRVLRWLISVSIRQFDDPCLNIGSGHTGVFEVQAYCKAANAKERHDETD